MKKYKVNAVLFLSSQGITLFGSSIVQFALIWFVALETVSGIWVSALTAVAIPFVKGGKTTSVTAETKAAFKYATNNKFIWWVAC